MVAPGRYFLLQPCRTEPHPTPSLFPCERLTNAGHSLLSLQTKRRMRTILIIDTQASVIASAAGKNNNLLILEHDTRRDLSPASERDVAPSRTPPSGKAISSLVQLEVRTNDAVDPAGEHQQAGFHVAVQRHLMHAVQRIVDQAREPALHHHRPHR